VVRLGPCVIKERGKNGKREKQPSISEYQNPAPKEAGENSDVPRRWRGRGVQLNAHTRTRTVRCTDFHCFCYALLFLGRHMGLPLLPSFAFRLSSFMSRVSAA
jgi:hypothetical protein